MPRLVNQEVSYSFRRFAPVVALAVDDKSGLLVRIEALLLEAGKAYRQRRYLDAIAAYNSARRLMWSQIQPRVLFDDSKIRSLDLVKPFVSFGNELLNVLPAERSVGRVRPGVEMSLDLDPLPGLHITTSDSKAMAAPAGPNVARAARPVGATAAPTVPEGRATVRSPGLIRSLTDRIRAGVPRKAADTHVATGGKPSPPAEAVAAVETSGAAALSTSRVAEQRSYVFRSGGEVKTVTWGPGEAAATDVVLSQVYDARRLAKSLPDILIAPEQPADVAVGIAHAWHYESPLGLAECYHALGDWVSAERWYLTAAKYQYLNAAVEAPYVWSRIATLYLDWGDSLFRDDDAQAALPIYEKVIQADGAEPPSELYRISGLTPAADQARNVIAHLTDPAAITATPTISSIMFDIWAQLSKIVGGLDFWGHWAANVPIWTFDYLQAVSVTFCQLAISAERDAMTFWEKADLGQLTRTQLVQNVAQSKAERAAAQQQVNAAKLEAAAFVAGEQTAKLRAQNARKNAQEYEDKSWDWTLHQAQAAQLAGGADGDAGMLNSLADQMMSGSYSISGKRGTLSAAEQLAASRIQRDYEIDSLKRQAAELDAAQTQATAERKAAQARTTAAEANAKAADLRVANAQQLVAAFDEQRFTPDVWHALGERMGKLSGRYLAMALDVAKRMQRAYNFENDTAAAVIKPDYSGGAVHGLLAADTLLADVHSFTHDLITSTAPKAQPMRQTISLAERYPFLFETQLRPTGRMEFQTTLDDFDNHYPGSYAGRIAHVEVEVDGIVPARGLSGTLTNTGISQYRVPAEVARATGSATKHRVQSREALLLSDYDVRLDALMFAEDRRRRRIFEGAGLASTWTLALPKEANDLDFEAITDVRLTFSYEARYDPELRDTVIAELAARPQAHERQRPLPVRWLFPDAFFAFYETGILEIALAARDFPATQTQPKLTGLSLIAVTTPRAKAAGIVLQVGVPGREPIQVITGADGTVAARDLAGVAGADVFGQWRIELRQADNSGWVDGGKLALDAIDNLSILLAYSFSPRS